MGAYAREAMCVLDQASPDLSGQLFVLGLGRDERSRWRERWRTLTLRRSAASLPNGEVDLWHVLDGSRAYLAPGLGRKPYVVTLHDIIPMLQMESEFPGHSRPGLAARWVWRNNAEAMRGATAVSSVSESSAQDAVRRMRVQEDRVTVVPLPLRAGLRSLVGCSAPCLRVPPGGKDPLVLHVGSDAFYKNRMGVLRVFERMTRQLEVKLAMAGSPPSRELRALACELGIESRVAWVENPSDQALAGLYSQAALMLFPSLYEGFGWPVVEALSFGLPVIASDRGSLPELLGDSNSVFDPSDVRGMADAAVALLSDTESWFARSRSCLTRSHRYAVGDFSQRMIAFYRSAVERVSGA